MIVLSNRFENKQFAYFLLSIAAMVIFKAIPLPESIRVIGDAELTRSGQTAMGVLIFALILWMTEAIPFHITGLMSLVFLTIFKVGTYREIIRTGFGNDTVTFFIGVLILSAFITTSGLGKRIGIMILSITGNSTAKILFGFIAVGALLAMWITAMAVAAMLMPLAVSILEEEGVKKSESNFGRALLIACAWGAIIGGVSTPAGAGPNALSIGLIKEMAGIDISFVQWMTYGIPAALLMAPFGWMILMVFYKPEMTHLSKTKEALKQDCKNLPPMSKEEIVPLFLFLLTITFWLTSPGLEKVLGIEIPISMPILFTSCLFFVPKMSRIPWKKIEQQVSWSGVILIVSGISLGMTLYSTGTARWLSIVLLSRIGSLPTFLMVLAIVFIISLLKIVFSSNTVTATIIIPIMIELSLSLGLPVLSIALPSALVSSQAYILVTSSPTNVIPYSAGYFSIADFAKSGIVMTIFGSFILSSTIFVIGKFTQIF